jgi:hypothetical protein
MKRTVWKRVSSGMEEASEGVLNNAPGRGRLTQSDRQRESPSMRETGGQEYTTVDRRTLEHHPPRTGGIPTHTSTKTRKRRTGEKEHRDE